LHFFSLPVTLDPGYGTKHNVKGDNATQQARIPNLDPLNLWTVLFNLRYIIYDPHKINK
jgi:hypothetical protein